MKKLMTVVLAVCMMATVGGLLASCAHQCAFSDAWSKDDTAHWHACEDDECTEVASKADHTWNEGEITTPATQEADGVKTFTCTVCDQTKTEDVAFTGMTEDEWNDVIDDALFDNFTYTETAKVIATGIQVDTVSIYKFTKNAAHVSVEVAGQSSEQSLSGTQASQTKKSMVESLFALLDFDDYTYDAETKSYILTGSITLEALGTEADEATVKFENGKLVELTYTCQITESGVNMTANSTITITDYGTTVIS